VAINPDELRREALALPDGERADLAAELLVSLETSTDEDPTAIRSAWGAEIERRARLVMAGEATTHNWTTVRQQVADTLDG
jgi:hypothetical protein